MHYHKPNIEAFLSHNSIVQYISTIISIHEVTHSNTCLSGYKLLLSSLPLFHSFFVLLQTHYTNIHLT